MSELILTHTVQSFTLFFLKMKFFKWRYTDGVATTKREPVKHSSDYNKRNVVMLTNQHD